MVDSGGGSSWHQRLAMNPSLSSEDAQEKVPLRQDSEHSANLEPSVSGISAAASEFECKHGPHGAKLTLLPLIAVIFFEVSGGPCGVEDSVRHGGPLLAILGFTLFPVIWSIPEALITAELSTAYPENGGFVVWVSAAFGPFWGFQVGWYKWLSGMIDNALYPILFLDYLKHQYPAFGEGIVRQCSLFAITAGLTYWNYRGLVIVGMTALLLTILGLLPFAALCILAVPKIQPRRWLIVDLKTVQWRGYLNNLFWNLNYWDSVSTLAGEVENPKKTFPKALLGAVILVVLAYMFPLLAGTGASSNPHSEWTDGYFAVVATAVGGTWLGGWITVAAALSTLGAFQSEMSSDAFQLLGMAERGMLPEVFTYRSKFGTPVLAILCSAAGILLLSWMDFSEIVEFLNFLYCFGMFLEFGAFVALRFMQPELPRPYSVPVGRLGAVLICLVPSILLLLVMTLAAPKTIVISLVVAALGACVYPLLMWLKDTGRVRFVTDPGLPEVPKLEDLEEETETDEEYLETVQEEEEVPDCLEGEGLEAGLLQSLVADVQRQQGKQQQQQEQEQQQHEQQEQEQQEQQDQQQQQQQQQQQGHSLLSQGGAKGASVGRKAAGKGKGVAFDLPENDEGKDLQRPLLKRKGDS